MRDCIKKHGDYAAVAVCGMGCLCALGPTYPDCMTNLFRGVRKISSPTRFPVDPAALSPVFEVDDSQVAWFEHMRGLGRSAQLAVVAAAEALNDAGLSAADLAGKRVGVCIGTTVGNAINNEEFYRLYRQGEHPDMFELNRYFCSNPAEVVAREFKLSGPVMTVANACSSGTDALGVALSWLRADLCDIVVAGGSDELSHISYLGFGSLMISSDTTCTPFDKNRNGLNLGEGAAMLVLARASGRKNEKCIVSSYGSACDAYHITAPHPQGLGLRTAIAEALTMASIQADELAFINAHGTGTMENDRVEMQVFADILPQVPYFGVKGCTGHTLGAAGAIEAAITVGCLMRGEVPASVGFKELPDGVTNPPVSTLLSELSGEYALSQSLAFGGNNSVIIFNR